LSSSIVWRLAGAAAAWLTLLAPPVTLLCWLAGLAALPYVLVSLLLSPLVFGQVMGALRGNATRLKHRWMLAFGCGAVLLPLTVLGTPVAMVVSPRTAGLLVLVLWVVALVHARRQAEHIDNVTLAVTLPGLAEDLRFVQLSDIHVGSREPGFLERVVDQAMAHQPAFVVITGDLLDESRIERDDLTALSRFDCPVYLCIGNHERYVDLDKALDAIAHQGVTILRDDSIVHGPLRIIGVDDRDRPDELPGVLTALGKDAERIDVLLYHRPDGWSAARAAGIPLTLSGHTHGGQIWPFGLLVKRQYPEMTGRFDRDDKTLYVSAGTGTWGPALRLGTRSEMTIVELLASPWLASGDSSGFPP